MTEVAVGIDLGTTYSVVAVCRDGQVSVVHNEQGSHTTPSCVSFTEIERLVGDPARKKALINPKNTVFGVKRFLGRAYNDPGFQEHLLTYTYSIIDIDNKPIIEVDYKKNIKRYAPEEISAMILELMKNIAETYLQEKVTKAVITVPAHFNNAQRQATKDAGRIAGLEVMRIMNEPTAAALAYGYENKNNDSKKDQTILVYDFGGGTFDVSIINIKNDIFDVKTTTGEAYLGGDDIDITLTNHFVKEFKQKHNINLYKNKKAIRRLRHQCEKLKRNLSFSKTATIDIDVIHIEADRHYDLSSSLTRMKLEQLCSKLFDKSIDCVKKTLKDAKLKPNQIDEVILVGGSTRIPRVRELVEKFFNKKLNATMNPDEAVAQGAAIQAAKLMGDVNIDISNLQLHDVNPLSLGIETHGGEMSVIIPRNTRIPVSKTEQYETSGDYDTNMSIEVYEGESLLVSRNRKLGDFEISGFPKRKRGEVQFDVSFEINDDGILDVNATQIDGLVKKNLQIAGIKEHLSEEQIQKMIDDAEKHRKEDEILRRNIRATIELQQYVNDLKDDLLNLHLDANDDFKVTKKYENVLDWLDSPDVTAEQCRVLKEELHNEILPIFKKYNLNYNV